MGASLIAVTEGSGKNSDTWQRVKGANTVEGSMVMLDEPPQPTYTLIPGTTSVATTTANSHLLQIMAGAALNVYVRRILMYQTTFAGAVALFPLLLVRLSTAGTGGTAHSFTPSDLADSAAGATSQSLPTVKGTESSVIWSSAAGLLAASPPNLGPNGLLLYEWDFAKLLRSKAVKIPAGVASGLAVKNTSGVATSTVTFAVEVVELNY